MSSSFDYDGLHPPVEIHLPNKGTISPRDDNDNGNNNDNDDSSPLSSLANSPMSSPHSIRVFVENDTVHDVGNTTPVLPDIALLVDNNNSQQQQQQQQQKSTPERNARLQGIRGVQRRHYEQQKSSSSSLDNATAGNRSSSNDNVNIHSTSSSKPLPVQQKETPRLDLPQLSHVILSSPPLTSSNRSHDIPFDESGGQKQKQQQHARNLNRLAVPVVHVLPMEDDYDEEEDEQHEEPPAVLSPKKFHGLIKPSSSWIKQKQPKQQQQQQPSLSAVTQTTITTTTTTSCCYSIMSSTISQRSLPFEDEHGPEDEHFHMQQRTHKPEPEQQLLPEESNHSSTPSDCCSTNINASPSYSQPKDEHHNLHAQQMTPVKKYAHLLNTSAVSGTSNTTTLTGGISNNSSIAPKLPMSNSRERKKKKKHSNSSGNAKLNASSEESSEISQQQPLLLASSLSPSPRRQHGNHHHNKKDETTTPRGRRRIMATHSFSSIDQVPDTDETMLRPMQVQQQRQQQQQQSPQLHEPQRLVIAAKGGVVVTTQSKEEAAPVHQTSKSSSVVKNSITEKNKPPPPPLPMDAQEEAQQQQQQQHKQEPNKPKSATHSRTRSFPATPTTAASSATHSRTRSFPATPTAAAASPPPSPQVVRDLWVVLEEKRKSAAAAGGEHCHQQQQESRDLNGACSSSRHSIGNYSSPAAVGGGGGGGGASPSSRTTRVTSLINRMEQLTPSSSGASSSFSNMMEKGPGAILPSPRQKMMMMMMPQQPPFMESNFDDKQQQQQQQQQQPDDDEMKIETTMTIGNSCLGPSMAQLAAAGPAVSQSQTLSTHEQQKQQQQHQSQQQQSQQQQQQTKNHEVNVKNQDVFKRRHSHKAAGSINSSSSSIAAAGDDNNVSQAKRIMQKENNLNNKETTAATQAAATTTTRTASSSSKNEIIISKARERVKHRQHEAVAQTTTTTTTEALAETTKPETKTAPARGSKTNSNSKEEGRVSRMPVLPPPPHQASTRRNRRPSLAASSSSSHSSLLAQQGKQQQDVTASTSQSTAGNGMTALENSSNSWWLENELENRQKLRAMKQAAAPEDRIIAALSLSGSPESVATALQKQAEQEKQYAATIIPKSSMDAPGELPFNDYSPPNKLDSKQLGQEQKPTLVGEESPDQHSEHIVNKMPPSSALVTGAETSFDEAGSTSEEPLLDMFAMRSSSSPLTPRTAHSKNSPSAKDVAAAAAAVAAATTAATTSTTTITTTVQDPPMLHRVISSGEPFPVKSAQSTPGREEPPSLRRSRASSSNTTHDNGVKTTTPVCSSDEDDERCEKKAPGVGAFPTIGSTRATIADVLANDEKDGWREEAEDDKSAGNDGSLIDTLDQMMSELEDMALTPRRSKSFSNTSAKNLSSRYSSEALALSFSRDSDDLCPPLREDMPVLVRSINNDLGIPKGDVMISLLDEKAETAWSSRVHEAVWRCRIMRQNCDTKWLKQKLERKPGSASNGRTSLVAVDVDDVRIIGGVESVNKIQHAAFEHLKYDDLDDAIELYEDIAASYQKFFEDLMAEAKNSTAMVVTQDVTLFKTYVGACLHNIGMVRLLQGQYKDAFTFFERATMNRLSSLGADHTDHIASFVKMATCRFALEEFVEALPALEECLALIQHGARSISDQRQQAEVLNNLGCLTYICGQPERAMELFFESFQVQSVALDHSLYSGARFSCHSATLNMSVTKGNIGFIALVKRDLPESIASLEFAVGKQQLLLRDAHTTLMSSMDHLVVAQLVVGNKEKALLLLRRMFHIQVDAFGADDNRCYLTSKKIEMLQKMDSSSGDSMSIPSVANKKDDEKFKRSNSVLRLFKSLTKKKPPPPP